MTRICIEVLRAKKKKKDRSKRNGNTTDQNNTTNCLPELINKNKIVVNTQRTN